jgi:hypothetical protein
LFEFGQQQSSQLTMAEETDEEYLGKGNTWQDFEPIFW